jgi:4-alpha-glucanotransferase
MTDDDIAIALAEQAGLLVTWTDARGERRTVALDTLKAVLKALELPADNAADVSDSSARLRNEQQSIPALQVVKPGGEVRVAGARRAELVSQDGTRVPLHLQEANGEDTTIRAPLDAGYYHIGCDAGAFDFAVAPPHALRPRDLGNGRKLAALAVQIYALRGGASDGFGDFAALAAFAKEAALFGADPGSFSPYSPSTRLFLNPLFADLALEGAPAERESRQEDLIDWRRAGPAKYQQLRAKYARFRETTDRARLAQFRREGGERLLAHALFEALDARFRAQGIIGFNKWPADFHSPEAAGARACLREAPEEIEFQLFLQWLSARSAAAAQAAARETMTIGIIADIAVGMDPQGSHAWSAPAELLRGLHVGAPPDIFNSRGQDWGLTSLSPRALRETGYNSFLETLRATMAYAGGVRIDHALGYRRLWVIPSGASPADGVYLRYPQQELLELTALESQLNRAIVIGEDLGTVPEGFRDELGEHGVLGMQVLWFERDHAGDFIAPERWRREAVAMTTTHDLPTVSGWWSGRDIDWQARLGHLRAPEDREHAKRAADRHRLWSAVRSAHCATGESPPAEEPDAAVTAALKFIGESSCELAVAAIEDIAGEWEQPNLPGTTSEHPNWRRRLKQGDILHDQEARSRLEAFVSARNVK